MKIADLKKGDIIAFNVSTSEWGMIDAIRKGETTLSLWRGKFRTMQKLEENRTVPNDTLIRRLDQFDERVFELKKEGKDET